jgi:hypothetical protein
LARGVIHKLINTSKIKIRITGIFRIYRIKIPLIQIILPIPIQILFLSPYLSPNIVIAVNIPSQAFLRAA